VEQGNGLHNKRVVILGGSSGIGLAVAEQAASKSAWRGSTFPGNRRRLHTANARARGFRSNSQRSETRMTQSFSPAI